VVLELDPGGSDVGQMLGGGVPVEIRVARGLAPDALRALVEEVRAAARCVVASGPPLIGENGTELVEAFDAVVVVARAGVTTPAEARVLRAVVASAGIEIAGVILTESDDVAIAPRELRTRLRHAAGASPELDQREAAVEAREQDVAIRESELERREQQVERREAAIEGARRDEQQRADRERRLAEEDAAARREAEAAAEARRAAETTDWGDPEHGRWRFARLERSVEEVRDGDPGRAEEIGFFLDALRPLASSDGLLPASMDSVVEEAFGDLLPR
jgi:hypothetical protein